MGRLKLYSFLKSDIVEAIVEQNQNTEKMKILRSGQNMGS
jgi:hypothetical protein